MIELELKYQLTAVPEAIKLLKIKREMQQSDIYLDTAEYTLLQCGNFLRLRDKKKLDFKVDLDDASHLYCKETSFNTEEIPQKITEVNKVLQAIGLPLSPAVVSIDDFITRNNFKTLANISKTRVDYIFDKNITISVDNVNNLGLFLEAEIMIEADTINSHDAQNIKNELMEKLSIASIIEKDAKAVNVGYVELYLLKNNPAVYELGKFKL